MNNQDVRIRRIKNLMISLNKEIDRAFEQKIPVNVGLVERTKSRDTIQRYHVEIRNDTK